MSLQLYRVEHQNRISYAVLNGEEFFFVDPTDQNQPLSVGRSAPKAECRLLNPTQPSKIIGVGLNYRDHAEERNKPIPAEPLLFLKPPSSLLLPGQPIRLPESSQRVDPEG